MPSDGRRSGSSLSHLIGFVTPWRIATLQGFTYRTTAFNGAVEIGDSGVRLTGLVWLALAIGFVAAGYGVWRGEPWALGLSAFLPSSRWSSACSGCPRPSPE